MSARYECSVRRKRELTKFPLFRRSRRSRPHPFSVRLKRCISYGGDDLTLCRTEYELVGHGCWTFEEELREVGSGMWGRKRGRRGKGEGGEERLCR